MSTIKNFRGDGDAFVTLENGKTALLIADADTSGLELVNKFGENPDIDTATTPEDIIDTGGMYPFQSTNQALELFTNVADAGKTVTIEGLHFTGGDYLYFNEEIVIAGGVQALSNVGIIVFRMTQIGGTNINDIDCRIGGAGAVMGRIRDGKGQTLMAIWAGATGQDAQIKKFYATMTRIVSTGKANLRLVKRLPDGTEQTKFSFGISVDDSFEYEYVGGIKIDPGEIVFMRCDTVSANDIVISGGFDVKVVGEFS